MAATPLRIQETPQTNESVRVLKLSGPLIIMHVREFQEAMRSQTAPRLILDFTAVPYIDSAGIGTLVGLYVSSQKSGRMIAYVGINEKVRAIMQMTNVAQLFPMFASVGDAERSLL